MANLHFRKYNIFRKSTTAMRISHRISDINQDGDIIRNRLEPQLSL